MDVASFVESSDETDSSSNEDIDIITVNFLRIPYAGAPPKIIIHKSQQHVVQSPFDDDEMESVRKVLFCRDVNDRTRRTMKVWQLPLTWNQDNIRSVFGIFGDIHSVSIQNHTNIINRHCLIRFRDSSKVDFAMNYDSSSIIQPVQKGAIRFGIHKYLRDYIKTRPLNVGQLQHEVNKFMASFDRIQDAKKERKKKVPRRHRGWIQSRDSDGFTKIHYPNKWERKKNKAYRIDANAEEEVNAPPKVNVYDTQKKENYYKYNQIRDIYKQRKKKLFVKQNKAKQKMKVQMKRELVHEMRQRLSIAGSRLQRSMNQKQRWNKDMRKTTDSRKNRKFKPT